MAENSKIEWCDHTFNPWIGCSKVHTGCKHCYAETLMDTRYGRVTWGPASAGGTRSKTSAKNWNDPLRWQKEAAKAGVRRRVFCSSLADVFEDWKGEVRDHEGTVLFTYPGFGSDKEYSTDNLTGGRQTKLSHLRSSLFDIIDATPNLDWLLLTKRPENIRKMWPTECDQCGVKRAYWQDDKDTRCSNHACPYKSCDGTLKPSFRKNVWLGTSPCDQQTANQSVPALLDVYDLAPVLFLSAEPLIGPVNLNELWVPYGEEFDRDQGYHVWNALTGFRANKGGGYTWRDKRIHWVIYGGESGSDARPCDVNWIRKGVQDCQKNGTAVFVKQLGTNPVDGLTEIKLSDKKGADWNQWPTSCDDIKVREFPK